MCASAHRADGSRVPFAAGMELAIETRGLTKHYGERIVAVDALDLRVRRGEV
jgi:hypothetical protein